MIQLMLKSCTLQSIGDSLAQIHNTSHFSMGLLIWRWLIAKL